MPLADSEQRAVIDLLFAARDLAHLLMLQTDEIRLDGATSFGICAECGEIQSSPDFLDHQAGCYTGRVHRALAELRETSAQRPKERSSGESPVAERAPGVVPESTTPRAVLQFHQRPH